MKILAETAERVKKPPRSSRTEPPIASKRLQREHRTMTAMMECYCHDQHGTTSQLCGECSSLLQYAELRLARCRFGEAKPTCANCPIHCYQAQRREQIKVMMRYAGPRMLWKHPVLALRHLVDGYRKIPTLTGAMGATCS